MADEPQQTGDDQSTPDTQETGEGQQTSQEAERIAQLEQELKNTNAYITRMQQQQPANPAEPQPDTEPDDGSAEYSQYGLTKEQVQALRKVTGADELQAKLDAAEKREKEREQKEQTSKIESDFAKVSEKYSDKGVPVPNTPAEKEKLLSYMQDNGIYNMDVAFREMHSARLNAPAEKPKAAVSDRSDAPAPSDDAKYKAALKEAGGDLDKLAEVEAQFKGNPTN